MDLPHYKNIVWKHFEWSHTRLKGSHWTHELCFVTWSRNTMTSSILVKPFLWVHKAGHELQAMMPISSIWTKPHKILVKTKISASYINTHWKWVYWNVTEVLKVCVQNNKIFIYQWNMGLPKITIVFQRHWATNLSFLC